MPLKAIRHTTNNSSPKAYSISFDWILTTLEKFCTLFVESFQNSIRQRVSSIV
jgi:hypothetical protein